MSRASSVVLVALVGCALFAPVPRAAASEQAEPTGADAKKDDARQKALQLYAEVDELISTGKLDDARTKLSEFNAKYAGTPDIRWVGSLNREITVIGMPVPESWGIEKWFQGEDEVSLDGKQTTLLLFWEVWCPHCKNEVPKMQRTYETHKGDGLQVLGLTRITRTATEDEVTSFIDESGAGYPIAKENGEVAEYFKVKGIPAAAVIKDGTIVWRGHPMRLTTEMLKRWL